MRGWARLPFLLVVSLIAASSPEAQTYSNPVRIPTSAGQDPVSVFAVDLNGDGRLDLLYAISSLNSIPGTMQTLLAQATGGYAPGPALTLPLGLGDCYPADLNGDGKQDLVCLDLLGNQSARVATFLGNGDGSFQAPFYSGFFQSDFVYFSPLMYAPAKLNTDSFPDLIMADTNDPQTIFLLNDGTGHFNVASTSPIGPAMGYTLYVTDINGDAKPDLISSFGPTVWLGNGNGTFGSPNFYGSLDSCNLHDMDADGHLDAVCVTNVIQGGTYTGTNQLAILHGNADGSFNTTPIASQTFGDPQGGDAAIQTPLAIADVNGDGIPDILAASEDGLSVLLGEANLQFAAPVHYAVSNYAYQVTPITAVADLNGDGYLDIVSTGPSGLYITYGKGDGTFKAPPALPIANILGPMTVADFNGDGIQDIAFTGDQSIELSLGKGDGTFQPFVALPNGGINFAALADPNSAFHIAHGDFRGIGRQDILAIGSPGTYEYDSYLLFNNGGGTFSPPQQIANSSVPFPNLENFAIADFNADGRDDFLTTSQPPGSLAAEVGLSNGDGTFNMLQTVLPNTETGYALFPAVADFNKDGKPDLVYVAGANADVVLGNGDGTFSTNAVVLPIPPYQGQSVDYAPLAVATGDFDGDGNQDFAVLAVVGPWGPPPIVYTTVSRAVYVFYGNGNGTFSPPVIAAGSNAGYDTIYVGDVNKDGRQDLILETTGTEAAGLPIPGNSVGMFLSEPGRLFGPETVDEVGERGSQSFVVDVNGDGYPDLLVSNSSFWAGGYTPAFSNSVTELLNLGPQTNSGLVASTTALTASNQTLTAGTPITLIATVSGSASGGGAPTGSVRFSDQTGIQTTVPLAASGADSAVANFTTSGIGPGADTMSAAYSGDETYAPSFATTLLTVTGLPDIVTLTATPTQFDTGPGAMLSVTVSNPAGSTAATPTGYIEFYDGSTILGGPNTLSNGSTTFGSALNLGSNTLTARYSGDLLHASGSASVVEDNQATPTVTPIPNTAEVTAAQSTTLQFTVTDGPGNPTPTGSVVLSGGGYTSTSAVLQKGSANITIPARALPVGDYTLLVTYTPDAASATLYLTASASVTYDVTAVPPGFTVSGTAVTVAPGATTGNTSTVTLTPAGGFTGNVNLSAALTSGPAGAQYPPTFSFGSTSPVAITGTTSSMATLMVTTTGASNSAYFRPSAGDLRWCGIGGASIMLLGLLGMRRRSAGCAAALNAVLLLVVLSGAGVACGGGGGASGGGGGSSIPGTTPGTYTVTVTGTSGSINATGTVTVTVQ